ncbi:MAG: hypothetical protein ACOC9B_07640 [Chloroflexota bacterium]
MRADSIYTGTRIIIALTGTLLEWSLVNLGSVFPGQVIGIEYDAGALSPGPNLNKATSSGHCSVTSSNIVVAADLAVVVVYAEDEPPPGPEDVLYIELEVEAHSSGTGSECHSLVSIHVAAEDLTGGSYPVQNAAIYVNSLPSLRPDLCPQRATARRCSSRPIAASHSISWHSPSTAKVLKPQPLHTVTPLP